MSSPYVLKEFRNRWFVFGRRLANGKVFNLALDRIQFMGPAPADAAYIPMGNFDPEKWFNDMIGVTKDRTMKSEIVRFRATPMESKYIRTKPFHKSQMVIEEDLDGFTTFEMRVIVNPELERDLLAYGEGLEVLSPKTLRDTIKKRLKEAIGNYKD